MPDSVKRCDHCKGLFTARRNSARYCSNRCRVAAHRQQPPPLAAVWLRDAAFLLSQRCLQPAGVHLDIAKYDIQFADTLGKNCLGTARGYLGVIRIEASDDPLCVLSVLLHELIHTAHPGDGHRGGFAITARAVGLLPPMRATAASDGLTETLKGIAQTLGAMPVRFVQRANSGRFVYLDEEGRNPKLSSPRAPDWVPDRR